MTYAEQCKKKNEFAITLILFLILLLDLSYSKPLKATFNVTITWDVIADGILENASLDVTIPTNSQNQKIISMEFSDPYKIVADSESKIRFEFSNVRAKRITANFTIETNYLERYNYLANGTKDSYISNSTYVIIDKDISNLANQFNQSSPYDLYEMQKWVYQNIKYNASFTDVSINDITYSNMPSNWVLEKRTGVCDEFSNLFAAMSRAKGYPTRIILGYAYVDKKWIPHAWTEVYSPDYGWIEIDPTHNQFMNLNALRVRTGVGSDISLLHDSISAVSKDATSINIEENVQIQIINYSEEDPFDTSVVFSPQPPLDQNQPTIIKIKNKYNYPVFLNAIFIPPVSVECKECSVTTILQPKQIYEMDFNLKLPPLNPNTKYTFPNTLLTDYNKTEVVFERLQIEQSLEEKYRNVEDFPLSFKIFIGLFIVAAVVIVAIALMLGL